MILKKMGYLFLIYQGFFAFFIVLSIISLPGTFIYWNSDESIRTFLAHFIVMIILSLPLILSVIEKFFSMKLKTIMPLVLNLSAGMMLMVIGITGGVAVLNISLKPLLSPLFMLIVFVPVYLMGELVSLSEKYRTNENGI